VNGKLFKVRHREWQKECALLMLKTTPWLILLLMPHIALMYLIGYIADSFMLSDNAGTAAKIGMIGICIFILSILFFLWAKSYFAHGSMILMHRIDNGMKKDPITAIWYVFHDRHMWADHFNAFKSFFKEILIQAVVMASVITLLLLTISIINPPDNITVSQSMQEKSTAITAARELSKAFFNEHYFLSMIKYFCSNLMFMVMVYLIFQETYAKFNFNSFMQANSYKSTEQCIAEGKQSAKELLRLKISYILVPCGAPLPIAMILPDGYPFAFFIVTVISSLVVFYSLHMNYIIGRDYYIGPPAKKVTEKEHSINGQLA
jgi:hypothetical protein